jgi:hypothetical protein
MMVDNLLIKTVSTTMFDSDAHKFRKIYGAFSSACIAKYKFRTLHLLMSSVLPPAKAGLAHKKKQNQLSGFVVIFRCVWVNLRLLVWKNSFLTDLFSLRNDYVTKNSSDVKG